MLLFDIDDTLINHTDAEKEAARLFGIEFHTMIPDYSDDTFVQLWQTTTQTHINSFLNGDITFQEQRRRRIREIFHNTVMNNDKLDHIFSIYRILYEKSWKLFDDVVPFFTLYRDFEFAILSDGSQEQQEMKLRHTHIHQFFKFIITAESEGLSKPDVRFFLRACERSGKPPSDIYYIGDNLIKDALGASNAGLHGVWLNRKRVHTNEKVDTIHTLTEFNRILRPL